MTKKVKVIEQYLTQNNNEVLNELIENKRTQQSIAEQFGVSKPTVSYVLLKIEPNFRTLHRQNIVGILETLKYYLEHGIPLFILLEEGFADRLWLKDTKDIDKSANALFFKFRQYGVVKKVNRTDFASDYLVQRILETIKIETLYHQGLTNKDILKHVNVSKSKISKVISNIEHFNKAMPLVSDILYKSIKRNKLIYDDFVKHGKLTKNYNLSEEEIKLILKTMTYYNKKDESYE